jgi:hypothetical protein
MSFYNDECDLVDDDQYDLFTSTSLFKQHSDRLDGQVSEHPRRAGREPLSGSSSKGGQQK